MLSIVEVCVDYGGVNVFHVCLDFVSSMVLGFVSMSVVVCAVVCCLSLASGCCCCVVV